MPSNKHHFCLIGLNHNSAPIEVRERLSLSQYCTGALWPFPKSEGIDESLILSTCNRVEVLASGRGQDPASTIIAAWSRTCGVTEAELRPYLYILHEDQAILHLFRVASSLDSLVVGEPQILGQVKQAFTLAVEAGQNGAILNRLLHKAFSVAKRVRTETAVASSAVSISYAAVELAKRIFPDLRAKTALLIGAGEMAELAALHLRQAGVGELTIINRTPGKAEVLAAKYQAIAQPLEALDQCLIGADIVICSTSAQEPILLLDRMRGVQNARAARPLFIIDIALPRDVDPAINQLDSVYLYEIDDLREIVEENRLVRQSEAQKAELIVQEEVANFQTWLDTLSLKPTITALVRRGENLAQDELERTLRKLGPVDDKTKSALEQMAKALVRKLNHQPIAYLKGPEHGPDQELNRLRKIGVIHRVFALQDTLEDEAD